MVFDGKIYDISLTLSRGLPRWPGSEGLSLSWLKNSSADGVNESSVTINSHLGTHIDLPYHFIPTGKRLGEFEITRFIGPALVIEHHGGNHIDSDFLNTVTVPEQCNKILFKTRNTERNLYSTNFTEDYTALTLDGAHWLLRQGIDCVGIDYLSIEPYNIKDNSVHKALLNNNILILEGLDLTHVPGGMYQLIALPLKIPEAEASPVRALLIGGSDS